ncbi:hypothetical protein D3C78_1674770 [compost metagenome]
MCLHRLQCLDAGALCHHFHNDRDRPSYGGGIHDGYVARDDAPRFHPLDAALNGGRGKIDLLGHEAQRHGVVALDEVQDGTVEFVQRFKCCVVFGHGKPVRNFLEN